MREMLTGVGVPADAYPPLHEGVQGEADAFARELAWVFLGVFALKTGLRGALSVETAAAAASVLRAQHIVADNATCTAPSLPQHRDLTCLLSDIRLSFESVYSLI